MCISLGILYDIYVFIKALSYFEKAEYEATKGIHMSPTFQGALSCIQIKIFSSVMLECASNLDGIQCFIPIHCLNSLSKTKIETIITAGLSTIMKRAESSKWYRKTGISSKKQDIIDPFLACLYNTYSLSACLTDPYRDCTLPMPDIIEFTINVTYISEGEQDNLKLEVLLHDDIEVVLFVWKEFHRYGVSVFLRYQKTTWNLAVTNGNLYTIQYNIVDNTMTTRAGQLEKQVGWPKERMSVSLMIEEAQSKLKQKMKSLSYRTYKWIKNMPFQYLTSMDLDLDEANNEGITLLHALAEGNERKGIRYLIDKFKNIDPYDSNGQTPLHKACIRSNFKTAKFLIENGADVNGITEKGESPLTILAAQKEQDFSLIKMLLDHNANREHQNNDHMRAIDFFRQSHKTKDIVKLLRPS